MNRVQNPFRIKQGTTSSDIVNIIEQGLIEYHFTVAQNLPGAKWFYNDDFFWMSSGAPFDSYNGVFRSSLSNLDVDRIIKKIIKEFSKPNLPFVWQLGPSSTPKDLNRSLIEHGFVHDETEPGMMIDLITLDEKLVIGPNIRIKTVRTAIEMNQWIETWACGAPQSFHPICHSIHGKLVLSEKSPWQYFVATMDDHPVATALLFLGEQTSVVHWIATLPHMRRKGIGSSITLDVLKEAKKRGYHTAVLTASDQGIGIYKRMGFKEYCKISKYKANWQTKP